VDRVTQQNAANAEQSSSAALELSAQAVQMKAMVDELLGLVDGKVRGAGAPREGESPAGGGRLQLSPPPRGRRSGIVAPMRPPVSGATKQKTPALSRG
jgi:methyl-accepting chemotaxis protein